MVQAWSGGQVQESTPHGNILGGSVTTERLYKDVKEGLGRKKMKIDELWDQHLLLNSCQKYTVCCLFLRLKETIGNSLCDSFLWLFKSHNR